MRSTSSTLAALAALILFPAGPAAAEALSVKIDHATPLSVRGQVANVFVGNAAIADVVVVNRNTLMVVGKGYGVTGLNVLDSQGRVILARDIRVVGGEGDGRMTLYRGSASTSFSCAPSCEKGVPSGVSAPAGDAAAGGGAPAPTSPPND